MINYETLMILDSQNLLLKAIVYILQINTIKKI